MIPVRLTAEGCKAVYYVTDPIREVVIKIQSNATIVLAAAFKHTYQKYLKEFEDARYEPATYLEILIVTGWTKERIQLFIETHHTEYAEGQVWPREFEETDRNTAVQLWDSDTKSRWL